MSEDHKHDMMHKFGVGDAFAFDEAERKLREAQTAHAAGCTWKPGQLLRPRELAPVVAKGTHILFEVLAEPVEMGGTECNIRVAGVCGEGHVHTYLAAHWMFEESIGVFLINPKA